MLTYSKTPLERTRAKGITSVEGIDFFSIGPAVVISWLEKSTLKATLLEGKNLCSPLKNAQAGFNCICLYRSFPLKVHKIHRVFLKMVLHKDEEKMQEKMKMTSQRDENLVQVQQQCSVYFCIKTFSKS